MVVHRRKKVVRYRGHTTHGGGHRKKRRGSGSRGGRGNAGTGKRSGHKKDKYHTPIGRRGFTSKRPAAGKAINLGYFTSAKVSRLVQKGLATQEKGHITINLEVLGYAKLLATGTPMAKLRFIAASWSAHVEERLNAVGGTILRAKHTDSGEAVEA